MSAEITKVVINIGKKTLELTPDEAKELKHILGDLFGGERVVTVPQPYPYPVAPYRPWFGTPYTYWQISNNGTNTTGVYSLTTKSSND